MTARNFSRSLLVVLMLAASQAWADDGLKQKLTGDWEFFRVDSMWARQVMRIDFQSGLFEEQYFYSDEYYTGMINDYPEYTRKVFPPKRTGAFKVISEAPDQVICDFLYDQGFELTFLPQDDGTLEIFLGLALEGQADIDKYKGFFSPLSR